MELQLKQFGRLIRRLAERPFSSRLHLVCSFEDLGLALPKSTDLEQRVRDFTSALTSRIEVCDGEVRLSDGAARKEY